MRENLAVIGMQWGDEGKGKIVDMLSPSFDIVARFQGGNNAGHTVRVKDKTLILHTVPSGALHPNIMNVIGNGVVVNPEALIAEIDCLKENGIDVTQRLLISDRAHLILPYHLHRDVVSEKELGQNKIGTTSKGIGPTYGDRVQRRGIRAYNLKEECADEQLIYAIEDNAARVKKLYNSTAPATKEILTKFHTWRKRLNGFIADTSLYLSNAIKEGKTILFEGAQGTQLDIDHGTYPFVTSSNSSVGGISAGLGIPPKMIGKVLGITKAYTTRVGEGPFPTELNNDIGCLLQEMGAEFGATTGRPRRCGWFDLVIARYAVRINGLDFITLTKLDVLDQFDTIKICTSYEIEGKIIHEMPASIDDIRNAKPVYKEYPGWKSSTAGISNFNDLPDNAKKYIEQLELLMDCPIALISTGPSREQCIIRKDSDFFLRLLH